MKLVVLISGLAWMAGCGDSSPSQPDATAAVDAAPAAPDAALDKIQTTVQDSKTGAAIVGAKVCVLHHDEIPCVTTDGTGTYTIAVPDLQGKDIAVETTASGHLGNVALEQEPVDHNGLHETVWQGALLYSDAAANNELATEAGFTYPGSGTGFLMIRVNGATAGSTGATLTLSPSSGKGPVYWDVNGPNPKLTATEALGIVSFGDLAPGTYAVTVVAPQKTCTVTAGGEPIAGDWQPTGSETTKIEVAADAYTVGVNIDCQ